MRKITLTLVAILTCVFFFNFSATAQKRKPTTKKPTTTNSTSELREGVSKTAIQLKNISLFVYRYGKVVTGLELTEKDVRAGKISANQNERAKQTVVQTIRGLRAGLAELEVMFRTKNGLKPYLNNIQGISELCGSAEDQASNGQFDEAGKTLLSVIERLTDALAAMP
jgi:YbbR domain-containing protein